MHIDLKLRTAWLRHRMLGEFRRIAVCVPTLLNDTIAVDRVELAQIATVSRNPINTISIATLQGGSNVPSGYEILFHQPVLIRLVGLNALEQNNTDPSAPFNVEIQLVFRLRFGKDASGQARFRIEYDHVDLQLLATLIPDSAVVASQIDSALLAGGASAWIELQFDELEDLLGSVTVRNLGAAVTAINGNMLVLRVEINGPFPEALSAWTSFYEEDFPLDLPAQFDWQILVHKDLFLKAIRNRTQGLLNKAEADGEFLPHPALPLPTWHPTTPFVQQTFSGEIPEACVVIIIVVPVWVNLDIDVTMDIIFSVPSANRLRLTTKFFGDVDDAEVAACAITGSAMWAIAGLYMYAEGAETVQCFDGVGCIDIVYSGLLLGPLAVFAGILAAAETLPGLEKLKFEEAQQIANTNADLELRVDFDELNLPPGMELTDVAGSNEGLLLQGTLAPPPGAWHPAELKIVSASDEFLWRFADICDSPSYNAMATIRFRNDQNQTGAHTPLQLCRVEVIDDDDNRYGPYLQLQFDADAESGEITFEIPHSEVQTVGPGYDCKVLIVSSGGTRLITIGGFEGVSQAEVDQAMMMLKGWQLIFCRLWADIKNSNFHNPKWDIDPPPEKLTDVYQRLAFLVFEALPGTQLVVKDPAGEMLGTSVVDSTGEAGLNIVAPESINRGMAIEVLAPDAVATPRVSVSPTPGDATSDSRRSDPSRGDAVDGKLAIYRTDLGQEHVAGGEPVSHVSLARTRGLKILYAVTPRALIVFDITQPGEAKRIQQVDAKGYAGFVPFGDGGVLWGPKGALFYSLDKPQGAPRPVEGEAVIGATCLRGRCYLLLPRGIIEIDSDLRICGQLRGGPFRSIAVSARHIVLAGTDTLSRVAIDREGDPEVVSKIRVSGIQELRSTVGLPGHEDAVLVIGAESPARAVEFSPKGELVEVSNYGKVPHLLTATRLGSLQAFVNAEGQAVIARVYGSRPMNLHEIEGREPIDTSDFPADWTPPDLSRPPEGR